MQDDEGVQGDVSCDEARVDTHPAVAHLQTMRGVWFPGARGGGGRGQGVEGGGEHACLAPVILRTRGVHMSAGGTL